MCASLQKIRSAIKGIGFVGKHRVLVVTEDSVFSNGVELLLVLQENLEIVGVVPVGIQIVITEIERSKPDVVIINDAVATANSQLILTLLEAYPYLRIITFGLEGNCVNVYNKREVPVTSSDDLVIAIVEDR